jgi:AcrR family transcriptional regulator
MAASSERRRPTKADRSRARILDAAAETLLTEGYSGAGLRDIAARANMSVASLYYHFESRDALVEEVLRVGRQLISDAVDARRAELGPGAGDLAHIRAMMRAHVESLAEQGAYTSAAMRLLGTAPPELHSRQLEAVREYGDLWRDLIAHGQKSGEVRSGLDPSAMRMFVIGALNSIPDWYRAGGITGPDLAGEFERAFIEGLAVGTGARIHVRIADVRPESSEHADSRSRGALTRTRILESAARSFREKGFEETTFGDVAHDLGLQRESLYYHFNSRDEIAAELLRDAWASTARRVRDAVSDGPSDSWSRLVSAVGAHLGSLLRSATDGTGLVHFLARVPREVRAESLGHQRSYVRFWRDLLGDAVDTGRIRTDIRVESTALILINAMNWSVEWYRPAGRLPLQALVDQFLTMILEGLRRRD